MTQDSPSRKLDQYIVRFPHGMRDRLKEAAAESNRSLNAEIIARLEKSFNPAGTEAFLGSDFVKAFLRVAIEESVEEILAERASDVHRIHTTAKPDKSVKDIASSKPRSKMP